MMNKRKSWFLLLLTTILLCAVLVPEISHAAVDENQTVNETFNGTDDGDESSTEESNAEDQEEPTSESSDDAGSSGPEMMEDTNVFKMLFQLVLALAAVIAIMYFLLKFINKRTQSFQSQKTMQNLGGVPLGQNKSVQMIKIGDRLLIVGVGDSIRLLKEIEEESEIEDLLENDSTSDTGWTKKGFSMFQGLFNKRKAEKKDSESFQHVLEDQLGEMKDTRKKARRHLKGYNQ
ncbi:flagellar biosynthetic protein FliO [Salibacterium salarium]|uniref:Flagellar protein n=1 Tax=Salibacterium salarium TaxID=284579 RepID=A0A428N317_9BACI|nr:flagellar biosynthetic protein FliO [Salibacterium salarium]RSL32845.1 flagellar biosynthetic protein FliO [Salibacterium salarium]